MHLNWNNHFHGATLAKNRITKRALQTVVNHMNKDLEMNDKKEPTEDERFQSDYRITAAALSIIKTYGHKAERKYGRVKYRLDCDMFQAAARHTGLINEMPRYWSAYTGQWMVHIPSLIECTHGMLPWSWNDNGECDLCPNSPLCYEDSIEQKEKRSEQ